MKLAIKSQHKSKKHLAILPGSEVGGLIKQDFHLSTANNLSGRRTQEIIFF